MEQIYTIPVNEAFDASLSDPACGCPLCALYRKLEENELDLILGASMMEPDIRIRTNREGFCAVHFDKMLARQNRLSLALMLESHLAEVKEMLSDGALAPLTGGLGEKPVKRLGELERTCYLCNRIEASLSHMLETVVLLWQTDDAFRRKFAAQGRFCLPHFRRLTVYAKQRLSKKEFPAFYRMASDIMKKYIDELAGDVSWFCKKFDYRYDEEPWYNAKDSLERTIGLLCAKDTKVKEGKRVK